MPLGMSVRLLCDRSNMSLMVPRNNRKKVNDENTLLDIIRWLACMCLVLNLRLIFERQKTELNHILFVMKFRLVTNKIECDYFILISLITIFGAVFQPFKSRLKVIKTYSKLEFTWRQWQTIEIKWFLNKQDPT